MGTKGFDCPFCNKHITKNLIMIKYKKEVDEYKKKIDDITKKENQLVIKEKELKEGEERLNEIKNYIENDLKKNNLNGICNLI